MVSLTELLQRRLSTVHYNPDGHVPDSLVRELVEYATLAPSSLNLQHWRFIAVTATADKQRLQAIAFNQAQVGDAAVTLIVLGDMQAHTRAPEIMHQTVQAGIFSPETAATWIAFAKQLYEERPAFRREEAIRSASMAAMTLMLVAQAKGLATGPMIGFDEPALRQAFAIADRYVPVLLLTIGQPRAGNWPRKPRLPIDEVLEFYGVGAPAGSFPQRN
ncbi:nitroreductase family protein [Hymenobacter terrenus]|uniref:nitroreductase family protein n=1 Tax=Hymenobacter terrenus TaxID=1629124 RepID=UPI0006199728|nr:nitroreductase family protein [Hymenobacter terrenus]